MSNAEPLPTYKRIDAIEAAPGHFEFKMPSGVVEAPAPVTEPVRKPREYVEPALPTYEAPSIKSKVVQWIQDSPTRRFDSWNDTHLYDELKAKRKREQLFLKAASLGLLDTGHDSYKRQLNALVKKQGV